MGMRTNRLIAWLGLLALWLIFAGPLVSQGLALLPAHQFVPDCAMAGGGMSVHEGHSSGHQHAPWAKCGYCELLIHLPLLPQTSYVALSFALAHALLLICLPRGGHAQPPVFCGARPRAPPSV